MSPEIVSMLGGITVVPIKPRLDYQLLLGKGARAPPVNSQLDV